MSESLIVKNKKRYYLSWYIRYPLMFFFIFFPLIFITSIKSSFEYGLLWIIIVFLGSAWVVVFVLRSCVEFDEDRIKVYGPLLVQEVLYKDITKLTILNFENFPFIPFYFRIYFKNEEDKERFIEIHSKEFAKNASRIFDEFKEKGFDIIKLDQL